MRSVLPYLLAARQRKTKRIAPRRRVDLPDTWEREHIRNFRELEPHQPNAPREPGRKPRPGEVVNPYNENPAHFTETRHRLSLPDAHGPVPRGVHAPSSTPLATIQAMAQDQGKWGKRSQTMNTSVSLKEEAIIKAHVKALGYKSISSWMRKALFRVIWAESNESA